MNDVRATRVAIVDYGMGNLYSVQRACEHVGLTASPTSCPRTVLEADGVILPGVGAFGDAIEALRRTGLDEALRSAIESGKPFFGICLGMQLLMAEGFEMGHHLGLGVIPGTVVRFDGPHDDLGPLKVPHVGWNRVSRPASAGDPWGGTLLDGTPDHEFMYFVHSFRTVPEDPGLVLATTRYGDVEFCSAVRKGSVFGCQFHPERSGPQGLRVYERFARRVESYAAKGASAC